MSSHAESASRFSTPTHPTQALALKRLLTQLGSCR